MTDFTLLTFNAGLLRAFGGRLQPTPFIEERVREMPSLIASLAPDVVLMQEVYDDGNRLAVTEGLRALLPFQSFEPLARAWGLSCGLMFLSRSPAEVSFHPFEAGFLAEKLFDRKGFQIARLPVPSQSLHLFNFHMTAGGIVRGPEARATERMRAKQIAELLNVARSAPGPVILGGDLNAGPEASARNYGLLGEAGFVDAHRFLHPTQVDYTWEPGNPLNSGGPHRRSPAQRVDHVFVARTSLGSSIEIVESRIVFREPSVHTSQGLVPLSDHYGVLVRLRTTSA
jgi:endonuclease/exonuclease/phosphatase family metal-dependent hydrolase